MSYDVAGIYTLFAGSNTISGNTIRNCGTDQLRSAGIMADGGTSPLVIDDNVVENCTNGGIIVSDSGHVITNNTLISNGTPVWNSAQVVLFPVVADAANIIITGNTMQADKDRNFIYAQNGSTVGHTINHNDYFGGAATPFRWGSSGWLNYNNWRTGFTLAGGNAGATGMGGGMLFDAQNGGELSALVKRTILNSSSAQSGGGVAINAISGSAINMVLQNCLIVKNNGENGSGIFVNADGTGNVNPTRVDAKVLNCTVADNNTSAAANDQIVVRSSGSGVTVVNIGNSVIWNDNQAATEFGMHIVEEDQATVYDSTTSVAATHSIIAPVRVTGTPGYTELSAVLSGNPLFIDAQHDNFRLLSTSPGNNKGANIPFGSDVGPADVGGTFRIRNFVVDMGSYEEPPALPGDINLDALVDLKDCIIALQILSGVAPDSHVSIKGDVNRDGRLGLAEAFAILHGAVK